jgi:DNA-directed RNA polymerase specialized sigma24 family protein
LVALNPVIVEIQRLIAFRASRLRRLFRLTGHDEEDLRQDAWADVVRAAKKHDPSRAPLLAYLRRCLDKWYACTARRLRAAAKRAVTVDHEFVDSIHDQSDVAACASTRLDAIELLSRLPPHVAALALAAADSSVAEAAREAGIHRGTAHRWLKQVREALPEFDPSNN